MKKIGFKVAALLMAGSMLCTSCIGSYSLFNKYEEWQCNMTKTKIVNGIVGFILQPIVAPITLVVDAIVLNTIEFWTGNNPLASNVQQVKGSDGRYYAVRTTKKGYQITSPTGEVTLLIHNAKNDSWTISQNGISRELIRFNADGTIEATLQNGKKMTITNDQIGLQQVQDAVVLETFYAER